MKANEVHLKGVSERSFGKSGGGVIEASLREGALVVYQGWCGPAFFTCIPTQWTRLIFIGEKLILEKHVFEKPESRSGDQVTYWEGTSKR